MHFLRGGRASWILCRPDFETVNLPEELGALVSTSNLTTGADAPPPGGLTRPRQGSCAGCGFSTRPELKKIM